MEIRRIFTALLIILAIAVDFVTSAAVMQNGCEPPIITNGRLEKTSRRSARGPMFKYSCRTGYRRQGHMFNVCLRGRWVLEHAVCVGRGCDPLPSPEGGSARLSGQKDVTTFTCHPGYQLIGDATLHCDGDQWNGTAPICQGPGARPWEAGARAGGGSARLFSARLPASGSVSGCVRFWHRRRHRQRPSDGTDPIAVYALVEEPSAPSGQLRVALQGTDGSTRAGWTEMVVPLPAMESPYQVVIEATRPARGETDVELDDVTLMHGDECGAAAANAPPPPPDRHSGGMSSRYREDREWTRVWQSTLHISGEDEATQTTDSLDHVSSGGEAERTTTVRSSASPSSTSSGNGANPHPQPISPRRGTGFSYRRDRVRRPGVAKHAPESPSTTSRPRAILPPSPGQRTHGAAGSAGFPARTRRPVTRVRWPGSRGRGEQRELTPSTAGDEEVTPEVASGQQVESGVRRQGRRLGHFGAFGDGGDVGGVSGADGAIDDGGDNGDCGDSDCGDYDSGSDTRVRSQEDGIADRDSQANQNRWEESETGDVRPEDANERTMFPMQTNSVSDKTDTVKSSSQVNRNALGSSNAGPITFPKSESHVRSMSAPAPGLGDPMNTMPLNNPSVLSTPPKINRRQDKTDMLHEMITEKTMTDDRNQVDSSNDKSSAILFPGHAGNKNGDDDSSATAGLPFYIVIAAAVGGCLLIITMVSVVLARRRRGVKVPVVIVEGSVFEPAPSDRSPIAELMRQNRLDHQPVVPAPVRL